MRTRRVPAASEALECRRLLSVEVMSVAAGGGATGNGASPALYNRESPDLTASVSDDGRYVAFTSDATDLVAGLAPAGLGDVYVRDRATGTTVCASLDSSGRPIGDTHEYGISGDGRFVAFSTYSPASPGDNTFTSDVLVRDLLNGTTTLVNRTPAGARANGDAFFQSVARNGRYVIFSSDATDLTPGVPNFGPSFHFFRHDLQTGVTDMITDHFNDSTAPLGNLQLSDDGMQASYVAPNGYDLGFGGGYSGWADFNVFLKDFTTGATTVATLTAAGGPIDWEEGDFAGQLEYQLSGDGSRVAFVTSFPSMTPDDGNGGEDVFVRDLAAGTTALVSGGHSGTELDGEFIGSLGLSGDGRYVLFSTDRSLTGLPDLNGSTEEPQFDVFVRDLQTGALRLVSGNAAGTGEAGGSFAKISDDGRYVLYETDSPGAVADDDDFDFGYRAVLRDLATDGATLLNRRTDGTSFDMGEANQPLAIFSRAGSLLLFQAGTNDVSLFTAGVTDANGTAGDVLAVPLAGLPAPVPVPPVTATLAAAHLVAEGAASHDFDVTFSHPNGIDPFYLVGDEIIVSGGNNFYQVATLVGDPPTAPAPSVTVRYRITAPDGRFDVVENGVYRVEAAPGDVFGAAGRVFSATGVMLPAGPIGTFLVDVPRPDGIDLEAVSLTGALPPSVVSGFGAKQKLKSMLLRVSNSGNHGINTTVDVRVVASRDTVADLSDGIVARSDQMRLNLPPGKSKVLKFKPTTFPVVPDGDYHLLGVIDPLAVVTERRELNNWVELGSTVRIAAPFVDLGLASPSLKGRLAAGKKATLLVTARNDGNQPMTRVQPVRVRLTVDPADPAAVSRTLDAALKLNLKPGASKVLRARLVLTDLPAGSYFVVVELGGDVSAFDPDPTDNAATSAGTYAA